MNDGRERYEHCHGAKEAPFRIGSTRRLLRFRFPGAGDADEYSDLDVFVEVERLDRNLKEQLLDIAWEVGLDNLTVISPLIYTRDEIENSPHRSSPIIKIIAQEGVRV